MCSSHPRRVRRMQPCTAVAARVAARVVAAKAVDKVAAKVAAMEAARAVAMGAARAGAGSATVRSLPGPPGVLRRRQAPPRVPCGES